MLRLWYIANTTGILVCMRKKKKRTKHLKKNRALLLLLEARKSDRINDRYALAVGGHEDQGSRGYSAF